MTRRRIKIKNKTSGEKTIEKNCQKQRKTNKIKSNKIK